MSTPSVEDYLKDVTPLQKAEYQRIRKLVLELAPGATETISYGIPTFKSQGTYLIYFGAFKNHMSLFPASDTMMKQIPELAKFRTSKGTLQYTEDNLVPDSLIIEMIRYRLKDIADSQK